MVHQIKFQGPTTSIWRKRLYPVTIALLAGAAMLLASNSAYSQNPRPHQPGESLAGFAARHVNSAALTRDHSAKTGSFIVFDMPGSACEAAFIACTTTAGINDEGTVVGSYSDANQAYHGFLRKADGTFLNIDVPARPAPPNSAPARHRRPLTPPAPSLVIIATRSTVMDFSAIATAASQLSCRRDQSSYL